MKKFKMMAVVIGYSTITNIAVAGLQTERAVVNDPTQNIAASVQFPTPVKGDLYIATKVGKQYLFLNKAGQFTPETSPFSQATEYSGKVPLFNIPAKGSAPGRYPLYQVVTNPGSNPLDFNNWVGGLGGLSTMNFTIGLPPEQSGDFNNDGFADNDLNKDGFYDDDLNKDGFHDSDLNKDGFYDDDKNRNGIRDNQENKTPAAVTPVAVAPVPVIPTAGFNNEGGSGNEGGFENEGGSGNEGGFENEGGVSVPPVPLPTPAPAPAAPAAGGTSIVAEGQAAYASCASAGCHGANPSFNQNRILKGRNPTVIIRAIAGNVGGMGFLRAVITADSANKISAYLNSK